MSNYKLEDFKDGELLTITEILYNYFGHTMPVDLFQEFVTGEIFYDYLEHERNTFGECSTDTMCRDLIGDAFSKFVCGMDWPINGDVAKYKEDWSRRFTRGIEKLGIKETQ